MAKAQTMPRSGSVRFASRPTKGGGKPSPKPSSGRKGMTPSGSFNSRPKAGKTQPKPSKGSVGGVSGPRFGSNAGRVHAARPMVKGK